MTARSFMVKNERYGNGYCRVATLICGDCGAVESVRVNAARTLLPDEVIDKKFVQHGWRVGSHAKDDRCPKCVAAKKGKTVLKVVPPSETPPRTMGRDDRRIIFEKLNDTYVDEKTGYDSGWSDHRVASDLGVPRKWVENVREEMFGSVGTNAEMTEFLAKCETDIVEAKRFLEEARKSREEVERILSNPLFASLTVINDKVSRLDKLAAEVRKLVVT